MTVSLWTRKRAVTNTTADVVVIGGGVAGISCALALQDRGVTPLVVERHTIGWGASSRNAGYLMRGAADNYSAAVAAYGRKTAKQIWQLTEANLRGLLNRGVGELPSCKACPSCLLALTDEEHAELVRSRDLLEEDGFRVGWLDAHDDSAWSNAAPRGGLVNPDDRTADPCEVIAHLASQLNSTPLLGSEVFAIEQNAQGISVHTSQGTIGAADAIICTNAYLNQVVAPDVAWIEPNRAQMLSIDAGVRRLDFAYYANHGGEYFCQPDLKTLVFGGKRLSHAAHERTTCDATSEGVQAEIESFARSILGEPPVVTARWAGIMGFTKDHLPLAGPVPAARADNEQANGRIWVCAGFNGHGASMAHETAERVATALVDGGPPPFPLDRPGLS
jgi:glycine/D-amino acid oxidase-like deaminating enzyme